MYVEWMQLLNTNLSTLLIPVITVAVVAQHYRKALARNLAEHRSSSYFARCRQQQQYSFLP